MVERFQHSIPNSPFFLIPLPELGILVFPHGLDRGDPATFNLTGW